MRLVSTVGVIALAAAVLSDKHSGALSDLPTPRDVAFNLSSSDTAGPNVPATPPNPTTSLWEYCKCKGNGLLKAMRSSDADAAKLFAPQQQTVQSPFQDYDTDLKKWGWYDVHEDAIDDYMFDFDYVWGVKEVFESLHMDKWQSTLFGGNNEVVWTDHYLEQDDDPKFRNIDQQTFEVDGKTYRETGAHFGFSINPIDGVIMSLNVKSPRTQAKKRNPPVSDDQLPKLSQWSDVGWLYYKDRAAKAKLSPKQLKCFMSLQIINHDTTSIMSQALSLVGQQIGPWPGYTFEPDSDGYAAILGTPNAQGFGYFLVEHKDDKQLGNLYISGIVVFHCDDPEKDFCLLLTVEPITPTAPKDPEPSSAAHFARAFDTIYSNVTMMGPNSILREHILGSVSMPKVIEVH